MHLRHLTIGLAALTLSAHALSATVYKWIDSNGVVHYSDQPEPGAQKIVTQTPDESLHSRAAAVPTGTTAKQRNQSRGQAADPRSAFDYTAFSIEMPMPEQNFTDAIVPVRVRLEPYLRQGQVMSLYLDGKLVENQPQNALDFTLTDVPRGAHALVATVMDTDSGESKSSPSVTFRRAAGVVPWRLNSR
jgi:hypothetical protein